MTTLLFKSKRVKSAAMAVIIILHTVGLIGIGVYHNSSITALTWANLLVTFCIGLCFFEANIRHLIIPLSLAFVIGIAAEAIGVETGYLFGDYHYGSVLGLKIFQVPITIGLLWAGLNIAAKNIANRVVKHPVLIALLAALLMVGFDFMMEPVAIHLHFWTWDDTVVPLLNYITWFLVSLGIQLLWVNVKTKNNLFDFIWIVQAIFFMALNILL